MKPRRYIEPLTFLTLAVIVMAAYILSCQSTPEIRYGRVIGVVTAPVDSAGCPFAPVELVGTNRGVLADEDGRYVIDSIPPAIYDLVVETFQYPRMIVADVHVRADSTTRANIQLNSGSGIWLRDLDTLKGPGREQAIRRLYDSGYADGVMEAEWEIAHQRAAIYTMGLGAGWVNLDRNTWLPAVAIAGCIVDSYIEGRAAGHNSRIRDFIEREGLPDYSRRRWAGELSDLQTYIENPSRHDSLSQLYVGGPAAISPDRQAELQLRRSKLSHFEVPCLFITGPRGHHRSCQTTRGGWPDSLVFVWGPLEADLVFLRWRQFSGKAAERTFFRYAALDLRSGRVLVCQ